MHVQSPWAVLGNYLQVAKAKWNVYSTLGSAGTLRAVFKNNPWQDLQQCLCCFCCCCCCYRWLALYQGLAKGSKALSSVKIHLFIFHFHQARLAHAFLSLLLNVLMCHTFRIKGRKLQVWRHNTGKHSGYKQLCLTNPPMHCVNLTNQPCQVWSLGITVSCQGRWPGPRLLTLDFKALGSLSGEPSGMRGQGLQDQPVRQADTPRGGDTVLGVCVSLGCVDLKATWRKNIFDPWSVTDWTCVSTEGDLLAKEWASLTPMHLPNFSSVQSWGSARHGIGPSTFW